MNACCRRDRPERRHRRLATNLLPVVGSRPSCLQRHGFLPRPEYGDAGLPRAGCTRLRNKEALYSVWRSVNHAIMPRRRGPTRRAPPQPPPTVGLGREAPARVATHNIRE